MGSSERVKMLCKQQPGAWDVSASERSLRGPGEGRSGVAGRSQTHIVPLLEDPVLRGKTAQ